MCLLQGLFISFALKFLKALVFLFLSPSFNTLQMSGISALALRIYPTSRWRPAGSGRLLSKDYQSSGDEPLNWLSNKIRPKSQHYPDTVGCIYTVMCTHIQSITIFFKITFKFERGDIWEEWRSGKQWKHSIHIWHSKSK